MTIERRAVLTAPELRADGAVRTITGYAAVFGQDADIGGWWVERIAPGAFRNTLNGDIRALIDHDSGRVIGRTTSGTLRLKEDERGLAVEIDLPDTQDGRDLATLVERGDISGMSFGFRVLKQEWNESIEPHIRTLLEIELYEVSAVAFPAYDATELALRSSREVKDERESEQKVEPAKQQASDSYFKRKAEQESKFRRI